VTFTFKTPVKDYRFSGLSGALIAFGPVGEALGVEHSQGLADSVTGYRGDTRDYIRRGSR
jgi:hypothetical protein